MMGIFPRGEIMRCDLVIIAKVKARDSIPNSVVKPFSADGTANVWESRTLPGHMSLCVCCRGVEQPGSSSGS